MLETILSGAAFGAALTASGVHQPAVIVSQLTLDNFHMVESFLTAAAGSAIVVTALRRNGYISMQPRNFASLGVLGKLDGNVIGGLIQGVGMALSGSCPGTVFAQAGAGLKTGLVALAGAVAGGIAWSKATRPRTNPRFHETSKPPTVTTGTTTTTDDLYVSKKLGLSEDGTLLALEAVFAAITAAAVYLTSSDSRGVVHPVMGGLLIASAQLVSTLARKKLLGTSASFEEAGDYFWWALGGGGGGGGRRDTAPRPGYDNMLFTAGIVLGAWSISRGFPASNDVPTIDLATGRVALGGGLLAIGALMGGGCTSGHGISGISLLSVSSFITVAAMFAGGIATALVLR